ncbi:hypothetical protein SAMN04487901_10695 [Prevotella communis]|uniref:Uncharacterized protein n=1 Tax=Prevotella communis TaxID=2913614 RepID=A0A1H0KTQ9_9BACT|nr:hypothetical protein SAMN04487901_10695 [Prevotella communis]SDO59171.1 hypothetical protein SAMN04487900_13010 [Prevotella communis]
MDYYAKIKPTLNKLSKLDVLDSLDVVRRYVVNSGFCLISFCWTKGKWRER